MNNDELKMGQTLPATQDKNIKHGKKAAGKIGSPNANIDEASPPSAELDEIVADVNEPAHEESNLDIILDIPVTVSLEIGRTQMSIRELLRLNQGSIVELNRLADEPMDVFVNGTLIAHGEVVVVNDKFGIRLTDVISTSDRVNKLQV